MTADCRVDEMKKPTDLYEYDSTTSPSSSDASEKQLIIQAMDVGADSNTYRQRSSSGHLSMEQIISSDDGKLIRRAIDSASTNDTITDDQLDELKRRYSLIVAVHSAIDSRDLAKLRHSVSEAKSLQMNHLIDNSKLVLMDLEERSTRAQKLKAAMTKRDATKLQKAMEAAKGLVPKELEAKADKLMRELDPSKLTQRKHDAIIAAKMANQCASKDDQRISVKSSDPKSLNVDTNKLKELNKNGGSEGRQPMVIGSNHILCGACIPRVWTTGFLWNCMPRYAITSSAMCVDSRGRLLNVVNAAKPGRKGKDAVVHIGMAAGDLEQMQINVAAMPENVASVFFILSSEKPIRLKAFTSASVRVMDESLKDVCRFQTPDIDCEDAAPCRVVILARIFKRRNRWVFQALGNPILDDTSMAGSIHDMASSEITEIVSSDIYDGSSRQNGKRRECHVNCSIM